MKNKILMIVTLCSSIALPVYSGYDDYSTPNINEGSIGRYDDYSTPNINEGSMGKYDDYSTPNVNEGSWSW